MSAFLEQKIEYVYVPPKHGMTSPEEDVQIIIKKIERDYTDCEDLCIVLSDESSPNTINFNIIVEGLKSYVSDKKLKKLKQIEVCSNLRELPVAVY